MPSMVSIAALATSSPGPPMVLRKVFWAVKDKGSIRV